MNARVTRSSSRRMQSYEYSDERAQDINFEDITSCERNANILRMLRDDDPNWKSRHLYILDEDIEGSCDEFVVAEGDDLGWLGYFVGALAERFCDLDTRHLIAQKSNHAHAVVNRILVYMNFYGAPVSKSSKELEWSLIALLIYCDAKQQWVNQFGEHVTLEELTRRLVEMQLLNKLTCSPTAAWVFTCVKISIKINLMQTARSWPGCV